MATRNNGKSIKMFYLSTNLPGKISMVGTISQLKKRGGHLGSVMSIPSSI